MIGFSGTEGGSFYYKPRPGKEGCALCDLIEFFPGLERGGPKVLAVDSSPKYSWHSAVDSEVLQDEEFAKKYWYKSGVLLAHFDVFNFTGGHFENLIASDSGPVVIDVETLFHDFRYVLGSDEERSILYKGLFQRRFAEAGPLGPMAAFQVADGVRKSETTPTALNERSDTQWVSVTRYFNEPGLNYPILEGRYVYLEDHLREFESGLRYGYFSPASRSREFLMSELWGRIKQLEVRQLIRQTKCYSILVCRSRISQVLGRPEEVKQLVRDSLMGNGDSIVPDVDFLPDPSLASVGVSPSVAYESECILRGTFQCSTPVSEGLSCGRVTVTASQEASPSGPPPRLRETSHVLAMTMQSGR